MLLLCPFLIHLMSYVTKKLTEETLDMCFFNKCNPALYHDLVCLGRVAVTVFIVSKEAHNVKLAMFAVLYGGAK